MLGFFGDFNDANLLFLGGIPRWTLWVLAGLALGVLVFSWADLGDLSRRKRLGLVTLRGLTFGVAFFLLLEPALELRHVTVIKNHVAFLIDSSLSMTLPHDGTQSRWEAVQAFLGEAESFLANPDEQHHFDVFRFSDEIESSTTPALMSEERPEGRSTRILEALEEVALRFPREELGGIVLASDGTDAGILAGRVRAGEALDEQTRHFVESLGAPVHTLAVGRPEMVRDVAVERVLVDDFAFVRNRVSIDVVVRAVGFEQGLVPVTLRREGEVLQTREISIRGGQDEYRVRFEFIPQQIGKEIYVVSLPVLAQEMLSENNLSYFILKVIRDKIRILQICGRPSWDERFLRQFLKSNPNVDLISFFILRTDASLQLVPESELSLIPFPTDEIFDEQLGSFDLVIFQNFSYRPYGMRGYLPGIEQYVREGGALLMIGGEQSFASGGYTRTPIANVLPVLLPPEGPDSALIDQAPFQPRLTAAGENHPITQLEFTGLENRRRWAELTELHGTNLVIGAQPSATVLLEHPSLVSGGQPLPVLSVMEVDDGRSMALTSDSTWRWSFLSAAGGGTSRAYSKFWNSAIRWLIQDPELKLIQVDVPQSHVEPYAPFSVSIRVFQPDYEPATHTTGQWELRRRPLDALDDPDAVAVVQGAEFTTDERGRVDLELMVEDRGAYQLVASATVRETGRVEDEDVFLSLLDTPELRDLAPRPDLLQALATASGGEASFGTQLNPRELPFEEARTVQVNRRRIFDIWNSPWVLICIAVLLGLEWSLRRRWGHP